MSAKGRTRQFTTEPGEEMRDRVISEPNAFFEIKPGHEKELAAASRAVRRGPSHSARRRDLENRPARLRARPLQW